MVRGIKDPQCSVSGAWLDITSKAPQRNICHAQSFRSLAWYFEVLVRYNIGNVLKYQRSVVAGTEIIVSGSKVGKHGRH